MPRTALVLLLVSVLVLAQAGQLASALAAGLPPGCQVFSGAKLFINNQQVFPDVPLLNHSGRTLVPMRIVGETLGAEVEWDPVGYAAIVTTPSRRIVMPIGSAVATVNGVDVPLDAPSVLYQSRTLVPLRFVAESMGCDVGWDPGTLTASVVSPTARFTGFSLDLLPECAVLRVATDGSVPYSVKTLADPPRLIVDLEGTMPGVDWSEQAVGQALISRVRVAVTETPIQMTRVICDLSEAVRFSHRPASEGSGVEVQVYYKVSGVRWEDGGVSIACSGPAQSRTFTLPSPDRYIVDLPGATLTGGAGSIDVNSDGIQRIRWAQFQSNPDIVRVVIDVAEPIAFQVQPTATGLRVARQATIAKVDYESTPDGGRLKLQAGPGASAQAVVAADGRQLRLEVAGAETPGIGTVSVRDGLVDSYEILANGAGVDGFAVILKLTGYVSHRIATSQAGLITLDIDCSPLTGKKIVLDPGHGGIDPGCTSYSGVYEKNVNWPVAVMLRERLLRAGAHVQMTRNGDESINAYGRVDVANNWGADVYVSIHCNAHVQRTISGTEVWHYGDKPASLRLAQLMINQLTKLGMVNRGVKKGNYAVLRETTMPAVLVELGFLSNPGDEKILLNPANQAKAADLMFEALKAYFR